MGDRPKAPFVSGNFDEGGPRWPERDPPQRDLPQRDLPGRDLPQRDLPTPYTEAGEPTTSLGDATAPDPDAADDPDADEGAWDVRQHGDRRRPTTAEQAVPWLIGLLLALTGMVVVLLALIFVGPEGVAGQPTPSPSASASPPVASATPVVSATPVPTEVPTASPPPTFGPLEMVFLGRSTSSSPIRLSRHDFSTTIDPVVVVEDANDVEDYAWAPDGRVGAAIIGGRAVALVEGQAPRTLTDPVDALVFGDDSTTLYGLRIARDGDNDRAEVLTIDFESGTTVILTTITYPHSEIIADPKLKEAQFADNGGIVRLYATVDGHLVAWILGDPSLTYRIDPADGTYIAVAGQPVLWSPDQRSRINVTESGGVTTLTLLDRGGTARATVKVTGLVSHVRWAGSNNEIVFTLGRIINGGVHQDLYVWNLVDGEAPLPETSNGASFGAEWLGVLQTWLP